MHRLWYIVFVQWIDLQEEYAYPVVELLAVSETEEQQVVPEIQVVIDQFPEVFAIPIGLPPNRECNHHIPLIPRARPFSLRPYIFAPELKDEIEKQIQEMLDSGVIQKSTSPFSSPILLIKKKDGTWILVVDYRHLNALILKGNFPVPVIDELLDELHGAQWFSKLDLRAGYHQIRLAEGEEYKAAFQTHHGHFEFKVLAFGLTDGPYTFQGAMSTTLSPCLRKYVVVFFDDILVFNEILELHRQHLAHVLQLLKQDRSERLFGLEPSAAQPKIWSLTRLRWSLD